MDKPAKKRRKLNTLDEWINPVNKAHQNLEKTNLELNKNVETPKKEASNDQKPCKILKITESSEGHLGNVMIQITEENKEYTALIA